MPTSQSTKSIKSANSVKQSNQPSQPTSQPRQSRRPSRPRRSNQANSQSIKFVDRSTGQAESIFDGQKLKGRERDREKGKKFKLQNAVPGRCLPINYMHPRAQSRERRAHTSREERNDSSAALPVADLHLDRTDTTHQVSCM